MPAKPSRIKEFLFENQNTRQTIAKNTFWLSFGEITGRLLRLGIVIYAARILGAAGWGVFSYLTSLAAVFTIFTDVGLGAVLIREVSQKPEAKEKYFSTTFLIKAVLILLSFLIIVFGTPFFTKFSVSQTIILFVGLLFIFDSLRRFGTSLFRAEEKMEKEAAVNILTQVVIVGVGFAALLIKATPEALAGAYALGSGLGLVLTIYLLRKPIKRIFSGFDRKLVRQIIESAWPLGIASIFGVLMVNVDTIMIGWFRGVEEVGLYAAAQKPIAFLYLLPALVTGGFFPVLSRLAHREEGEFRRILERGVGLIIFLALPLALGIMLTADQAIDLIYGAEYGPSSGPLRILSLTLITAFPIGMIINGVTAYNRQRELVRFWNAGVLADAGLNLLLIPIWGMSGAAWSSFFTQAVINTLIWRKMKKINNFSVKKSVRPMLLAAFIMGVAVILLRQIGLPLLLIVPLAVVVYLGSLIWSGETIVADFRRILKHRGKLFSDS